MTTGDGTIDGSILEPAEGALDAAEEAAAAVPDVVADVRTGPVAVRKPRGPRKAKNVPAPMKTPDPETRADGID
jgi:small conductance mechanosensitive channel